MKKSYPIITSLIAATVILTGCTTGSDGSSTTTTTVSKSSDSQEKIISAAQRNNLVRAMDLSAPSDKKYVLSIPFETDQNDDQNDEHYDEQFSISLAFKTDDLDIENITSQEEKSSKKTKKEDNYVYASMSGTNEHFKDIMKAFEPIITDNESDTRSFKTQRGETYITWEINQEDYPEVAEQVDNIFRDYYTDLNDNFNQQVGEIAQDALKHFDEKN